MKQWWEKISVRIDALSLRERVMVFAALVAVLLFIIYNAALEPVFVRQQTLRLQLSQQRHQLEANDSEITAVVAAFTADPDAEARKQLASLNTQRLELRDSLMSVKNGLVAPEKMVGLLEQMLRANGKLKLISLRTLPTEGLSEKSTKPAAAANAGAAGAVADKTAPKPRELLYRHGVEVTVQGSYLDMVEYMAALEKLQSQLFWGQARLDALAYPNVTLTLKLYTLSPDEKWMKL